VEGFEPPTRGL